MLLRFLQRIPDPKEGLLCGHVFFFQFVIAIQKQANIQFFQAFAQCQILPGRFRLLFQRFQMGFQFFQHIQHAQQIFVRPLHAALGLFLAGAVAADPGGFFKDGFDGPHCAD